MKDLKIILATVLFLMLLLYTSVFATFYRLNNKINKLTEIVESIE